MVKKTLEIAEDSRIAQRHLLFGWWSLAIFVALGITLEALHAFKSVSYMGVDAETRRLMWTLAHSHGTLLSIIQIVFGLTIPKLSAPTTNLRAWASPCLLGASLLMPLGFFLGGFFYYSGDPGIGIFLVPPGGLLLLLGVVLVAVSVSRDFR
ncbi:MAG: hypothetical protein ACOVLE_13255 [Pirellula staleyi]